jgi:AcrR family transcriptional regulator
MTPIDDPRERLLTAAGELFAEKGLDGATVREICTRAAVNIAAVNYYFRDKENLYIEAVKQASCGSGLHAAVAAGDPAAPPAQKLRDFIRAFVARMLDRERPAWHALLMTREMARPTSACGEVVREYIQPVAAVLFGILQELLPPGTPRRKIMLTGVSIVGQCVHHVQCKPVIRTLMGEEDYARLTPEAVAEHIAEFSLAALGQKAPPRRLKTS